jgi:hypothetical protein
MPFLTDYFVTRLNLFVAGLFVRATGEVQLGQAEFRWIEEGRRRKKMQEDAHRILVLLPIPYQSRHHHPLGD